MTLLLAVATRAYQIMAADCHTIFTYDGEFLEPALKIQPWADGYLAYAGSVHIRDLILQSHPTSLDELIAASNSTAKKTIQINDKASSHFEFMALLPSGLWAIHPHSLPVFVEGTWAIGIHSNIAFYLLRQMSWDVPTRDACRQIMDIYRDLIEQRSTVIAWPISLAIMCDGAKELETYDGSKFSPIL